jgi:hypothetical protein
LFRDIILGKYIRLLIVVSNCKVYHCSEDGVSTFMMSSTDCLRGVMDPPTLLNVMPDR